MDADRIKPCMGGPGFCIALTGMRVKLRRNCRRRCKREAAKPRVEAAKQAGTLGVDADMIKPCKGGAGFCIALTGLNVRHM